MSHRKNSIVAGEKRYLFFRLAYKQREKNPNLKIIRLKNTILMGISFRFIPGFMLHPCIVEQKCSGRKKPVNKSIRIFFSNFNLRFLSMFIILGVYMSPDIICRHHLVKNANKKNAI